MKEVLRLLPPQIRKSAEEIREPIEEIRLRAGCPAAVKLFDREQLLTSDGELIPVTGEDVAQVVSAATGHSVYAAAQTLREGYCIVPGGHRLGVCGRIVMDGKQINSLVEYSSVNLRAARDIRGAADAAANLLWQNPASTLILGPPGSGKTTVLRDLIRQLSDRFHQRVSVIDERGELGAVLNGEPQFRLGRSADILTGCPKEAGIYFLLRAMNPQWIALDEISAREDLEAMLRADGLGVRFLATVHCWNREDLERRSLGRELVRSGLFGNLITMERDRTLRAERMEP